MSIDGEQLNDALKRFKRTVRVPLNALAKALDLDSTETSPSRLQKEPVATRLIRSLRRERLPRVASELGLDQGGYRALEQLAQEVYEIYSGFELAERSTVASLPEAVRSGWAGVELFDRGEWDAAHSHLVASWPLLSGRRLTVGAPEFIPTARVGTQLAGLYNYWGRHREAAAVFRKLNPVLSGFDGSPADPALRSAVALAHKGAAIADRHLAGSTGPRTIARKSQTCADLLAPNGPRDIAGRIAALRDQAKPYVIAGLNLWNRGTANPDDIQFALQRLNEAEQLAGGQIPFDHLRDEWLLTRLAWIDCLATLQREEETKRLIESTFSASWVEAHLVERQHTPIPHKCRMTSVALLVAAGESKLDSLAEQARIFQNALPPQYGDWKSRATQIEAAAIMGEIRKIQRLLCG